MDIPALNHHVGSTERVFVANVNDLNDFYLHPDTIRETLIKLGVDLYKEYSESLTNPSGTNQTLHVGDYCACPSESEDWYRGLIRQLDSNGHATVFKIDYGDVQCVPIQFLQPLKERFFRPDRLAFHCSLVNLIKPLNGWPYDVIKEFCSRLTTTFLYAKFINYNEIRDLSEVEITEKSSKTILNKDFEPYQIQRSLLEINDPLVYKYIPMETLDSTQIHQIRMLYYISPSRFYVYLREKMNSHTCFQNDLQIAIQRFQTISSPTKYQPVVAQDNHAIWHRAVILDITADLLQICVYFIDIGQREYISINNIRPLPDEFSHKPAFAIPCRLYSIRPSDRNQTWQSNDQVHDEFNRLMANNVSCKICEIQKQICYGIEIDIPKVGDLASFLFGKNLVTRTTMDNYHQKSYHSGQPAQQSFVRSQLPPSGLSATQQHQRPPRQGEYYNHPNTMTQQSQARISNSGPQNPTMQQSSNTLTAMSAASTIITVPPQDGYYIITQVHSITEFYGHLQKRVTELEQLTKYLEEYYNNAGNDQYLSANFLQDGAPCVIQQGDKYYRVIIKHRESDSRVLVKLVDRGDEIIVDASELLQLDSKYCGIPAFAQPFRLRGYDESQSSANITRTLKRLILNQRVHITQQAPVINGFYSVEVTTADNQSVNQMLLSSDKNSSVTSPITNNRPVFNQPSYTHIESQVFNNSTKHHSSVGHDSSRRSDIGLRTNDVLPTVPKILTGTARTQPGRFGASNQTPSVTSSSNEPAPRFANFSNRNQQPPQTVDSNSMWNNDQTNKPSFGAGPPSSQQSFGRQQPGSSQFSGNQRPDDNKPSMTNNQHRFPPTNFDNQQSSSEPKRAFSGYTYDDKQTSGNNFQQNNNGTNENNFQRGGFNNRGSGTGFTGRGRGDFHDRNMNRNNDENNNENGSQPSGGFSRRGGGGFGDRGRGGSFQDRGGFNRNQDNDNNENNMQRSGNFNSNRGGYNGGRGGGGFQNRRDQGDHSQGGDFGRRGGFGGRGGGQREGGFGGRGASRDGFGDNGLRLSSDKTETPMAIGNWSNPVPKPDTFEASDRFLDNEIPKESFKFVLSHIESPNDFFIQLLSKGDELTKLSETLQTNYKESPEGNFISYKINQPCLAKSSDGCWYRAIVLSTGLSKINVRFIDFGDKTDVSSNTIRRLAKKHCLTAPYAYQCTFKNVQVIEKSNTANVIEQCVNKEFTGNIQTKSSDGKFILECEDFLKLLIDANTIKLKSEITLKRIKCSIAHNEIDEHRFFIQDDKETVDKIAELILVEDENAPTLSFDEVKQLEPNTIVLAMYEEDPYRAIIQSEESDENVNVCYVDFGNTSSSPKTSLKRCSEQLSAYPYQAKQCQLYGVPLNNIDNAFKDLQENSDSETFEISIVSQKDDLYNVLVFIDNQCINEKFGYDPNSMQSNDVSVDIDDQSSTTTATTVKEQEQPSSVAEKETNDQNSPDTSTDMKSEKDESETEEISSTYHQALLTHIEKDKPYVYLQLIPESESIISQIEELVDAIVEEDKHNPSYEIGDHIIAQFSDDELYYRARIESYSESTQHYTVYFLDYGNIDENVPVNHLFSYSDDLKQIEPQAHGYLLGNIHLQTWFDQVRPLLQNEKLNTKIEFDFLDDKKTTIEIKFDNENQIYNTEENEVNDQINLTTKTLTANISATDNDSFYIHILPQDNIHVCELEEVLQTLDKELKKIDDWTINDLCIVSNDQGQHYRGRILAINENKYDIKRIDYGDILQNVLDNYLHVIPDEEIFKQSPLAHQCRLYNVDDANQTKLIEDVIKNMSTAEQVTINVENDQNEACWLVILRRENNEIVNDQHQSDTNNILENENKQESDNDNKTEITLPDSVIAAENDTSGDDQQVTSSVESTHDTIDNTSSISTNQTIDFGENDPSTTIKDETTNSISSN